MMSVPGFQKRGGGMMILSRFCYKPEDVDCRYCLHYRRRSCQVRTCPYIAERLKSGAIEYLDLILEYFGHIPHAGLHKRIQAVEHWSGPDQAVLHTVSVHLRSRFADRVWDDAPPGYLAALYLLASKERLWQPALPALSHDSIDFSRIVSKPHGFAIQDYPIFYSARRLYDLKSPMEAEDLAHPKLVSDKALLSVVDHRGRFPKGENGPFFLCPFSENRPGKEAFMEKERLAEYLEQYHMGALNAATSRELELTFGIKGIQVRHMVNALRRDGVPIASNGSGYFYAATDQEVRATIAHLTRRISGIAAAIRGLDRTLEREDTAQTRLPLDGGDTP